MFNLLQFLLKNGARFENICTYKKYLCQCANIILIARSHVPLKTYKINVHCHRGNAIAQFCLFVGMPVLLSDMVTEYM